MAAERRGVLVVHQEGVSIVCMSMLVVYDREVSS